MVQYNYNPLGYALMVSITGMVNLCILKTGSSPKQPSLQGIRHANMIWVSNGMNKKAVGKGSGGGEGTVIFSMQGGQ